MKNKFIILLIIIFSSFYFLGADLLTKYLDEARGFYIIKDYKNPIYEIILNSNAINIIYIFQVPCDSYQKNRILKRRWES